VGQQAADLFVEVREDGGGAGQQQNAEVVAEGALGQACEGGVVQVLGREDLGATLCQGLAYVEGATAQVRKVLFRQGAGGGVGEEVVALHLGGICLRQVRGQCSAGTLAQTGQDPDPLGGEAQSNRGGAATQAVLEGSGQVLTVEGEVVLQGLDRRGDGVPSQVADEAGAQGPGPAGADDLLDGHAPARVRSVAQGL